MPVDGQFTPINSDDLSEGSSNLYFTNERVDDRVSALLIDSASSGIDISYDDSNNQLTISADLGEITTDLNERVDDRVDSLLTAGSKDMRFSLPNSRIMVHQPSGGYQGQVTDIEIQTTEIKKTKEKLNKIYAKHTGNKIEDVEKIMERDKYFSPEEAIKFGLIDKIVENRKN